MKIQKNLHDRQKKSKQITQSKQTISDTPATFQATDNQLCAGYPCDQKLPMPKLSAEDSRQEDLGFSNQKLGY